MIFRGMDFHGIEEMEPCPDGRGWFLSRYPGRVRKGLDNPGIDAPLFCAGAEIRFNIEGGKVRLRLQRETGVPVNPIGICEVWFGSFPGDWRSSPRFITADGDWIEIEMIGGLDELASIAHASGEPWDPRLVRLILPYEYSCRFLDVEGAVSPPRPEQIPSRRLLSYGSSITHGGTAVRPTETWAMRLASSLGTDLLNLGLAGNARLEPAVAEWIAEREDWDMATMELGINLIDTMETAEFAARARRFLSILASARPASWIFCIDLFSHYRDLRGDARVAEYRRAVEDAVRAAGSARMVHVDGRSLLDPATGLCEGLLHPSSRGHEEIGRKLAALVSSVT
jgi:hypothetical protein